MIIHFPPAQFDGYQNINPEKLNRNLGAARAAVQAMAERRWVRTTVTHRVGAVTVAAAAQFHIPVVTGLPYIIDRITVYGDVTGTTGTLQWGKNSTFSTEVGNSAPLIAGTQGGISPSRVTVLPGYVVAAGADWSDSFVIQVATNGASTSMSNITIEVAMRYDRNPGVSSDPYTPDLATYNTGDALTADRYNDAVSDLELFANSWVTTAARRPDTMYYVQLRGVVNTSDGYAVTVPLPGSGPETSRRILARAESATAGGAGQTVAVALSYGTWGTTAPVNRLTFSVDGLTTATGSTGAIAVGDALRAPTNAADDLLIQATTNGIVPYNIGMWVVRDKT